MIEKRIADKALGRHPPPNVLILIHQEWVSRDWVTQLDWEQHAIAMVQRDQRFEGRREHAISHAKRLWRISQKVGD